MDKDVKSYKSTGNTTPFLSWTGSKRWFVKKHLDDFLPTSFSNYHEPFLGAGSVFFNIKENFDSIDRKFFLSDTNRDLINTYIQLRDNPLEVLSFLRKMKNTSEEYYRIRGEKTKNEKKRAAKFIFLNKTSFNGIYRVNRNGVYNVPYGNRPNVNTINEELLLKVSKKLKGVVIKTQSFEDSIENIKSGDLVFLDPPYTVAHENNGFIEYNQKLFSWEDQLKLKLMIETISSVGAYFILTNASHYSLTDLYANIGTTKKISRYSQIGGRIETRGVFNEIVVYNTK